MMTPCSTEMSVSSGGPRLKQPGRVGSSAIKGAGFDFKRSEKSVIASISTGHGENIIESSLCL
jgi:isoaspartyl peptidase/L-asparaginase-like protein (Ntn-hydrolase superfamily)